MNIQALEAEMARQAIFFFAVSIITGAICGWLTYLLIKLAIRDGIKESGLIEALRRNPQNERLPSWAKTDLPEMRAD